MSEVRITVLKDGPVEVSGPVELVDGKGVAHAPGESPIYLCRCGQSATKPFCDGSHRKVGFRADAWTRT